MHPLDGPRLKIRRAKRQIERLRALEDRFKTRCNYEIVLAEFDPKRSEYTYRILLDVLPSLDWGVCIGEIAHNLRSALDNLVWQLALLNTDTPAWNVQFPIFTVGRSMRRRRPRPRRRGRGKRKRPGQPELIRQFSREGRAMIADLRPEHKAAIEWLQPYKRHNWVRQKWRNSSLYLLSEINNADKHRLIQVAGVTPQTLGAVTYHGADFPRGIGRYIRWGPALRSGHRRGGFPVPEDGAKVGAIRASVLDKVKVESRIYPFISFGEACPAAKGWGVVATLTIIANYASQVIESFRFEFE